MDIEEPSPGFRPKVGAGSNFGGKRAQSGQKWHTGAGVGHFERAFDVLRKANFRFSRGMLEGICAYIPRYL